MGTDLLHAVADRVYRLEDRFVNLYVLDLGKVALVDTGTRRAEDRIRRGLREIGKEVEDIEVLLLTHHHIDHVGTAPVWRREVGARAELHREDVAAAAHRERRPLHASRLRVKLVAGMIRIFTPLVWGRPLETDTPLQGGETLDVLGWPIEVVHVPGHTLGSCAFYARSSDILFAGDAVNGRHGTAEPPIVWEDAAAARDSFDRLTRMGVRLLLPGHGSPVRGSGSEPRKAP